MLVETIQLAKVGAFLDTVVACIRRMLYTSPLHVYIPPRTYSPRTFLTPGKFASPPKTFAPAVNLKRKLQYWHYSILLILAGGGAFF